MKDRQRAGLAILLVAIGMLQLISVTNGVISNEAEAAFVSAVFFIMILFGGVLFVVNCDGE